MIKKLCAVLLSANLIVCNLTTVYAEYNQYLSPPSLVEIQVDNEDLFKKENVTAVTAHKKSKIILDITLAISYGLALLVIYAKVNVGVLPVYEIVILSSFFLLGVFTLKYLKKFQLYKKLKILDKMRIITSIIILPIILYMILTATYFNKTFIVADRPSTKTAVVDQLRSLPQRMYSGIKYVAVGRLYKSENSAGRYLPGKDYPFLRMALDRIRLESVKNTLAGVQESLVHELGHHGYEHLPGPVKDRLEKYHVDNNEDFSHLGKYAQYEFVGVAKIKSKQNLEKLRDVKRIYAKAGEEAYAETVESWVVASEKLFLFAPAAESEALRYFIEHVSPNFIDVQNSRIFCRFYYPQFMNRDYIDVEIHNQSPSYEELREAYCKTMPEEYHILHSVLSHLYEREHAYPYITPKFRNYWKYYVMDEGGYNIDKIMFVREYIVLDLDYDKVRQDIKDQYIKIGGIDFGDKNKHFFKEDICAALDVHYKPFNPLLGYTEGHINVIKMLRNLLMETEEDIFKIFGPMIDNTEKDIEIQSNKALNTSL